MFDRLLNPLDTLTNYIIRIEDALDVLYLGRIPLSEEYKVLKAESDSNDTTFQD